MKCAWLICITSMLLPALLNGASPIVAIHLDPTKDMVPLKEGKAQGGSIRHPEWVKDSEKRAASLVGIFAVGNEWKRGSLSFTPEKDGKVAMALRGDDQKWILVDDVNLEGAELNNGGFEDGRQGWYGSRASRISTDMIEGKYALLLKQNTPLGQDIAVKAGQAVTISFQYRVEKPEVERTATIGDVVFSHSFASDNDYNGWIPKPEPWLKIAPDGRGGKCVEISAWGEGQKGDIGNRDVLGIVDKAKSSSFLMTKGLPFNNLKGYELEVEVGLKADHVPPAPKSWEGVRMAINYATTIGAYNDCYYNQFSGSFDWQTVKWRIRVPSNLTASSISLGLISAGGTICFDHVKMTVTDTPFSQKTPPSGKPYIGHRLPRLRGFNGSGPNSFSPEWLNKISDEWKANMLKAWFHMGGVHNTDTDLDKVDERLENYIDRVEASLKAAREKRIYVTLHITSKWEDKSFSGTELLYQKPEYAEKFIACWKKLARHFMGRKEIYAFELLNESHIRTPVAGGCYDYVELMERAAQAINAIDPERTILVQPEEWWGARAFYKMRPLKAKNVVYAVHFYDPFTVTHQGIGEWYKSDRSYVPQYSYPGIYDGVKWDKETLRQSLAPAREFQKAYNVHMIVTEFGCVRWAADNSQEKLVSDMIDVFEEFGWDWLYHGYPEWSGWMPDQGTDRTEMWDGAPKDTPTSKLLKSWFAQNQYPNFK